MASNLFSETSLRCSWHSWLRRRARAPASCCKVFLSWHSPGCVPLILSPLHAKALLSGSLRGNGISSTLLAVIPFSLDRVSPRQAPSVSSPRGVFFFPLLQIQRVQPPGFDARFLILSFNPHPLPIPYVLGRFHTLKSRLHIKLNPFLQGRRAPVINNAPIIIKAPILAPIIPFSASQQTP